MDCAPALAVAASLDQVLVRSPCRLSVPPDSMMPRSPMPPMMFSPLTLSVRVMVALRVCGMASVPMASSPWTMIHSVVSSRSALSAKLSLPLMVTPLSGGGLISSSTSLPAAISTLSPATGTLLSGQVAGSDHLAWLMAWLMAWEVVWAEASCRGTATSALPTQITNVKATNRRERLLVRCIIPPELVLPQALDA